MSSVGDTSASFCATLVDEWIRLGVRHAVVAPGSRSTPLAVQLAARPELGVHLFHDERSASFAALGIGEESGVPAVLLCTSGTAATHFHGAVVEAHQSNVPMIVCTADRPPELRDVGAPQTIDQTNLYGAAVRWFHDPGVPSVDAAHTWRSLAGRSWSTSIGSRPGPVHLNLPFREPLLGQAGDLPPARDGAWSTVRFSAGADAEMVADLAGRISRRRGIVVAGRGASPAVLRFAQRMNWPVLADARSGLRVCEPNVVVAFDSVLRVPSFADTHVPEVVVRVGEPPASKVTAQWITRHAPEVVQVQPTPMVTDPDHATSAVFVADSEEIFSALSDEVQPCDGQWAAAWNAAETRAQAAMTEWVNGNWSEPAVSRLVTDSLPAGSHLVVSSSMPIRDVEWFGTVTPGAKVHSNRGTNGIDGVVSTAIGVALSSGAPVVVLVGDVACLHDSSALVGLVRRGVDLRIVVTNNDGGAIFSFLPQASQVDESTFELLYGTPHGVSFRELAAAHSIPFVRAEDSEALAGAVARTGPVFIEVPFVRGDNVRRHDEINAAVAAAVTA